MRLWPNDHLPGELTQALPRPRHVEQASILVTERMVADALPTGPDPKRYLDSLREHVGAGYGEVYVQQMGPDQEAFFEFWQREIAPLVN